MSEKNDARAPENEDRSASEGRLDGAREPTPAEPAPADPELQDAPGSPIEPETDVATSSSEGPAEDLEEGGSDGADEPADEIRDLLRGALARDEPEIPDVLRGVQRKIRQRSGGRFFADGWSTERQPPINTYLVTSLVMLAIIFAVWAVLSPISGEPASVDVPAPVNVVPGPQYRSP